MFRRCGRAAVLVLLLALSGNVAWAAESPELARARAVTSSAAFQAAVAEFGRDHDRFVRELVALTEIPAPPFGEKARAEAYLQLLKEHGLQDVALDAEGNVTGIRKGVGTGPLLAVAAHLDTVFPSGTDVKVKKDGTILRGPGVGDDTRSLALMLAMIRAIDRAKVETKSDILFVGDVGEEGPGDLRGMRHLFLKGPYQERIKRFISLECYDPDGALPNDELLTNGALGSKRYRVTFKGPGGHSWTAFGLVSPSLALGNAIAKIGRLQVPKEPKVSFNVGVIGGGTSVNSIPFESWMDVDMRSTSPAELSKIDAELKRLIAESVAEENATRSTVLGPITAELKLIGDRPSGMTPADSSLVKQVEAAMSLRGRKARHDTKSTDSNIPMSLGIPAVTISPQGANRTGRAHSLQEWTDVEKDASVSDFALALTIVVAVANMP